MSSEQNSADRLLDEMCGRDGMTPKIVNVGLDVPTIAALATEIRESKEEIATLQKKLAAAEAKMKALEESSTNRTSPKLF